MKIVIDARMYGHEYTGIGRYLVNLISELSKISSGDTYFVLLKKKYFNALDLPTNFIKVESELNHYSFREQLYLPKLLKSLHPDIVHFPHFNVPVLYRGKFIVTIHDILMHNIKGKNSTTLPKYKYLIKRLCYKLVFEHAVKRSVKIIAPSNSVRSEIVNYYKVKPEKISTIYEGLDQNVINKTASNQVLEKYKINKPYFFYVGNAHPHKNLRRAIEAIYFLNQKTNKKTYYVIATGKNYFSKKLEHEIRSLNAQEYIKILGFIPEAELGALYENSKGLLYPSLVEGFGLQGLEAIANKCMPIISDIPVFKEIYKSHAVYFNPFDFSSIQKALETTLNMSKSQKIKKISSASKFIKKYDWSTTASETLTLYKQSV